MITIALKAGVAEDGMPRNTTVLSSVAISSAPIGRADEGELAAGERGAADHDREDRVELELVAGLGHVDRHHAGGREDAGDAGEARRSAMYTVIRRARRLRPASRLACGLMPIDSIIRPSALRRTEHERRRHDDRHREQEHDRQAEDVAVGDPAERLVVGGGVLARP